METPLLPLECGGCGVHREISIDDSTMAALNLLNKQSQSRWFCPWALPSYQCLLSCEPQRDLIWQAKGEGMEMKWPVLFLKYLLRLCGEESKQQWNKSGKTSLKSQGRDTTNTDHHQHHSPRGRALLSLLMQQIETHMHIQIKHWNGAPL